MNPLPERPLSFGRRLRFLLFPACCPLCGNVIPMQRLFCETCEEAISDKIFEDTYVLEKDNTVHAAALWKYDGQVRQTLLAYKFSGQIDFREAFGVALASLVQGVSTDSFDLVVSVPSDKKRVRQLGFDHAGELARQAAQRLSLPYRPVMIRTRKAVFQHTLKREDRMRNLKNVFAVNEDLTGMRVLLVDDIITTGASICACAEALYRAGAAEVLAVAVAKTMREEFQ